MLLYEFDMILWKKPLIVITAHTTLHYTTLRYYTTLHYTTLHYTTRQCIISPTLHFTISPILKLLTFTFIMAFGIQGPKYFTKDTLTNRDERFFTAEIIRESIFHSYKVSNLIQLIEQKYSSVFEFFQRVYRTVLLFLMYFDSSIFFSLFQNSFKK